MSKKILNICLIILICFVFVERVSAWSISFETYDNVSSAVTSCGNGLITKIPSLFPIIISAFYNVLQVAVPIVLTVIGSIDLVKGITAGKEDEMKKSRQLFVKRLISAALIFFVFIVVKLVISLVTKEEGVSKANRMMQCAECFVRNVCR